MNGLRNRRMIELAIDNKRAEIINILLICYLTIQKLLYRRSRVLNFLQDT